MRFQSCAEFWYITFGWLLGILGTLLTELIRNKLRVRRFKESVFGELHDLQIRLALTFWMLRGTKVKDDYLWVRDIISEYSGPVIKPEWKQSIDKIIQSFDQNRGIADELAVLPRTSRKGLRKLTLPILQAGVSYLADLKPSLGREITEILTKLSYFNELVDEHKAFFFQTFDMQLDEQNRAAVVSNLDQAEQSLTTLSKDLADQIKKVRIRYVL